MSKPRVLVIVGPTASGKSALAVELAKRLGGEVVSADSRQVYKGLDIGTGKITRSEMKGIPHHLLDVVEPRRQFTAAEYKKLAIDKIEKILSKGKLPLVVGGTGFYIDTLRMNLPEVPPNKSLRKKLGKKSLKELQKMLGKHKIADPNNKVRLVRAIEIIKSIDSIPKIKQDSKYDFTFVGLKPKDLEHRIYKRLVARVPSMIKEAKRLHKKGLSWKRMEELGLEYRYLARLLEKKISREQFMKELYTEIRRYSMRQMTWFRRNKKIKWFDSSSRAYAATLRLLAPKRRAQ